jgi:hypothetical protein
MAILKQKVPNPLIQVYVKRMYYERMLMLKDTGVCNVMERIKPTIDY